MGGIMILKKYLFFSFVFGCMTLHGLQGMVPKLDLPEREIFEEDTELNYLNDIIRRLLQIQKQRMDIETQIAKILADLGEERITTEDFEVSYRSVSDQLHSLHAERDTLVEELQTFDQEAYCERFEYFAEQMLALSRSQDLCVERAFNVPVAQYRDGEDVVCGIGTPLPVDDDRSPYSQLESVGPVLSDAVSGDVSIKATPNSKDEGLFPSSPSRVRQGKNDRPGSAAHLRNVIQDSRNGLGPLDGFVLQGSPVKLHKRPQPVGGRQTPSDLRRSKSVQEVVPYDDD